MTSENNDLKQPTGTKAIHRLLTGAALGALIISIPITAGLSTDLNLVQIVIASLLVLSCDKFIDTVMGVLNFFSS